MIPRLLLAAALLVAVVPAPSSAVQSPGIEIASGETVFDRSGGTVGTVASVRGDTVVVDTGSAKVTIGESSFRRLDGKLVLPMTRSALEAEAAKVQAGGDAAVAGLLKPGSAFFDSAGEAAGTVVSVEGKTVLVEAGSVRARLGIAAFDAGPRGAAIRSTRADFLAKLAAQAVAASPPSGPAKEED